jgi:hypothetical protein
VWPALGGLGAVVVGFVLVIGWVVFAGVVLLVTAAVLWVRHHVAPGDRRQFCVAVLLAAAFTGRQARRGVRGSSSSVVRWRAPRGGGHGGDAGDGGE